MNEVVNLLTRANYTYHSMWGQVMKRIHYMFASLYDLTIRYVSHTQEKISSEFLTDLRNGIDHLDRVISDFYG